jgi:hypothetical protein
LLVCKTGLAADRQDHFFGVTQTETGTTNLPGAGLPTSILSALTNSPVSRVKEAQGLGIRPNAIFWMGRPVDVFMMVAMMLIARR